MCYEEIGRSVRHLEATLVQQWNEYDSSDTPPPPKKKTNKKKKTLSWTNKNQVCWFMHFKFNYTVKIEILLYYLRFPKLLYETSEEPLFEGSSNTIYCCALKECQPH